MMGAGESFDLSSISSKVHIVFLLVYKYFFIALMIQWIFFSLGICQLLIVYHVEWSMIGK